MLGSCCYTSTLCSPLLLCTALNSVILPTFAGLKQYFTRIPLHTNLVQQLTPPPLHCTAIYYQSIFLFHSGLNEIALLQT